MKNEKKIDCAIIGLGRIGSLLEDDKKREKPATHAGVISNHSRCEITAGCDVLEEKNDLFSKRWNCKNVYLDYKEMLKNNKIDILHISTPPETHKDIFVCAAKNNVPVIVLEKPIANNIRDSKKILNIAHANGIKVVVNHERRYSLQYRRVKEVISSEKYGKLLYVNSKLYIGRNRKVSSMLYADGTHMVDLIQFLCNDNIKIENIYGSKLKNFAIASGICNDVTIQIETAANRDHLVFELDLSFESGRIIVGNGYYHEYESQDSPFYEKFKSLIENNIKFEKSEYFKRMFDDAVYCFENKDARPVSGIEDGFKTIEVIEKIIRKL